MTSNSGVPSFLTDYLLSGSSTWIIRQNTYKKLKKIIKKYKDPENCKGKLGEIYVADNLNYQLQSKGLKYSAKAEPLTYRIRYQYRGGKRRGRGGIDVYLRMTDDTGTTYRVMIEVSNWGKYHTINDYLFNLRIASKFKKYDRLNRCYHVVAMNNRNIRLIEDNCNKERYFILPLREHITPELIEHLEQKGEFS